MFVAILFPGFFATLIAFFMLLLATLSTPVIKNLYFLKVVTVDIAATTSSASTLKLGALGYCISGAASSALYAAKSGTDASGCTPVKLGYNLNYNLFTHGEVWGKDVGDLSKAVVKGLTYLLVLQPIAAIFGFIVLVFTFFAWTCKSRALEVLSFFGTIVASVIAWIAWIVAMALFTMAKRRMHAASAGKLSVSYGNVLWMGLASAVMLSIAVCFTFAGTFGSYSKKKHSKPQHPGHNQQKSFKQLMTMGKKPAQQATAAQPYMYEPAASSDAYPLIPPSNYQPAGQSQTIWQA